MFKDVPKSLHHKKWLGIGGTATAIAAIKLKLVTYDPKKVDNYYLPIKELDDILYAMKRQTAKQRKSLTGLEERRADVIVYGAMILSVFLKMVHADGIYACESDNLEGYLLKKLGVF